MRIRSRKHAAFCVSLLALSSLALAAPHSPTLRGGSEEEAPPPSFADIAPIVETNCTPCHGTGYAAADIVLETEADLLANKSKVEAAVTSGYMPYGQPDWKDSADGQLFLAWLSAQAVAE